jgi:xanthosine utilization system XapX-like protein
MEVLLMKTAMKILSALAAVVGIVYVVATYGDKIVQWAKNLLASCPCCNNDCEVVEEVLEAEEEASRFFAHWTILSP